MKFETGRDCRERQELSQRRASKGKDQKAQHCEQAGMEHQIIVTAHQGMIG